MLNGYSLFDYDVTLNALIQLMVVPEKPVDKQSEDTENKKEEESSIKVSRRGISLGVKNVFYPPTLFVTVWVIVMWT